MLDGLLSVSRQRASECKDQIMFENAIENTKVSDMFLADAGERTNSDIYDGQADEILNEPDSKELEKWIDKIPVSEDDDDIDAIIAAKDDDEIEEIVLGGKIDE